jgi:transcriptional antiterminator NusG
MVMAVPEEQITIDEQVVSDEQVASDDCKWYVVHTYSGYENKVKANLEKIIETRGMQDLIEQITVPVQESIEIKNDKKRHVERKLFPGYVFLKMIMNDDTWYVVRNTRGVTSFVGPGSKPVALTEEEIASMGIEYPDVDIELAIDEVVKVIGGPFEGSIGNVKHINRGKRTVRIMLSLFGRETYVELDFNLLQKL